MARRFATIPRHLLPLAVTGTAIAHAQPARLELRISAQSGTHTAAPARPLGCVFDDPPGIVAITPGAARRFEVQARIVDTQPFDGIVPGGVVALDFSITSTRAGLWSRAPLSTLEAAPTLDPPPLNPGSDCSGLSPARGLHGAYRGWDPPGPTPRNDDPRNGTISPSAISNIHTEPVSILAGDRWTALYTFEFTLPADMRGDLSLLPRVEPVSGILYIWSGSLGQVFIGSDWTAQGVLLRAPAGHLACCARGDCYLALTPSACFANDGDPAVGGVCTPSACCIADINRDGATGIQDVFDFVEAYLSGDPASDINHDGILSIDDLFAFLDSWYGGCPP
ncbi:MAG: hypothetical protein IT438_10340 [Phycisphaerales bacterium]|nr:hypothetical protein [Phycisphaerales bacterium]